MSGYTTEFVSQYSLMKHEIDVFLSKSKDEMVSDIGKSIGLFNQGGICHDIEHLKSKHKEATESIKRGDSVKKLDENFLSMYIVAEIILSEIVSTKEKIVIFSERDDLTHCDQEYSLSKIESLKMQFLSVCELLLDEHFPMRSYFIGNFTFHDKITIRTFDILIKYHNNLKHFLNNGGEMHLGRSTSCEKISKIMKRFYRSINAIRLDDRIDFRHYMNMEVIVRSMVPVDRFPLSGKIKIFFGEAVLLSIDSDGKTATFVEAANSNVHSDIVSALSQKVRFGIKFDVEHVPFVKFYDSDNIDHGESLILVSHSRAENEVLVISASDVCKFLNKRADKNQLKSKFW